MQNDLSDTWVRIKQCTLQFGTHRLKSLALKDNFLILISLVMH